MVKLSHCQRLKIRKGPISNHHIHFVDQISCSDPSKGPPVNSYFTSQTHLLAEIVIYDYGVLLKDCWSGSSFCATEASVVPKYHINTSIKKEPEIESMRLINHMLIKHGIGVTKNESRFVLIIESVVIIIGFLDSSAEEHRV